MDEVKFKTEHNDQLFCTTVTGTLGPYSYTVKYDDAFVAAAQSHSDIRHFMRDQKERIAQTLIDERDARHPELKGTGAIIMHDPIREVRRRYARKVKERG